MTQNVNTRTLSVVALLAILTAGVPAIAGDEYAFVLTTDYYTAAYYSTIEAEPPYTADVSISSVNADAVAYYDEGEDMVFVVNRFLADNIQIVDPGSGFATTGQYSVGNGSNPHDIRLAGPDKAYVSRFEWNTLFICDPYTGDSLGAIDLSEFADTDGIPEMDRMAIVGDRLFVTLNMIDHTTWLPTGPGKIAVIDVAADTLVDADPIAPGVQPIVLSLANPYTELRHDPCRGELTIGCLGGWGVMDGGVELIDPFTLESKGVIATEFQLGGDVSDVLLSPGARGYAVVMDSTPWPDNFARLVSFGRATGEVLDTLYVQSTGGGATLAGIEMSRQGEVYLCDRDVTRPRVRIYDFPVDTLITTVDVGVPPYDIVLVQQAHAGVPGQPSGPPDPNPSALLVCPNPARLEAAIRFELPGEAPAAPLEISVHDVMGRLVRSLEAGICGAGPHEIVWDGTDDRGRSVAGGIYYCRLAGGREGCARVVLLR
ncbi:MAG: FlgD immunoglobulin-like domain containing protein [bacterium]|jgi:hypothetical protein